MSSALEKTEEYYTYADYLEWDESFRGEIIHGVLYMMSPPLTIHQRILSKLFYRIANFLEGKTCEVFVAPFGVRLFPRDDLGDDTVVEPDIVVICDPAKIDERGCKGVPDLVIEILSPSTSRHDRFTKFDLYREAKVREFWVVDPENRGLHTFILNERGEYFASVYGINEPDAKPHEIMSETVPVAVLPGLKIDLKTVF
jgi:Uma2 family endonuclease